MTIVLLRGINVGGHKKVKMAELRSWLADAGLDGAGTYIQSGNVWVPGERDPSEVGATVARVLREQAGFDVPVVAVSRADWARHLAADPFPEGDDRQVHLGLPTAEGHVEKLAELAGADFGDERLVVLDDGVWMHTPNGMGRSKMAEKVSRKAGDRLTFRNRRTLRKLQELASH